ncbi:wd g-beta repeat-containing [Cystoisospora suis]|uniref:Wd g-beta repeat-containing n=1 Tax=Cystoisospora suis TaxID=483139 RepID=A0A2C6L2M6_9APIC|nr:wd g-beta repeat-containing [Cystoisospora suis]
MRAMNREDDLSETAPCPATQPGRLVSADLRGFSHNAVFQLDGVIKTMQCDADATEICHAFRRTRSVSAPAESKGRPALHHSSTSHTQSSRSAVGSSVFATAGDDSTIRIYSCWPRPQQLAVFSLKQRCCGLCFIQRQVLLALFDNGCLRLIDVGNFQVVGRLQATPEGDIPTSTVAVAENHALVATRSGTVLSIQLVTEETGGGFSSRDCSSGRTPETFQQRTIKHASISRMNNLLFGHQDVKAFSLLSDHLESPEGNSTVPFITHMAVQRVYSKTRSLREELTAAWIAVATRMGTCAVGMYAPSRSTCHMMWIAGNNFLVQVPPRVNQRHAHVKGGGDWVQVAFVTGNRLVVARATAVFLVDCATKEPFAGSERQLFERSQMAGQLTGLLLGEECRNSYCQR